jgi:hypothetical protein
MSQTDGWEIDEGITDPSRFFALIPKLLPQVTDVFIESSSPNAAAKRCYAEFAKPGAYLPARQTLFPPSKRFRCAATSEFFAAIGRVAETCATPELLDHLVLYQGDRELLLWHDAFANAILIDGSVSETAVASIATAFGRKYGKAVFQKPRRWKPS